MNISENVRKVAPSAEQLAARSELALAYAVRHESAASAALGVADTAARSTLAGFMFEG